MGFNSGFKGLKYENMFYFNDFVHVAINVVGRETCVQ